MYYELFAAIDSWNEVRSGSGQVEVGRALEVAYDAAWQFEDYFYNAKGSALDAELYKS